MKEEGIITNNDVLRSEMQLTNDRLAVTETRNNIRLVSQRLDILLGMDERLLLIPDTTLLEQTFQAGTYGEYVDRAFLSDPAMQLIRKQTELAENNIALTRAEQLPRLSLTASNTLARPVSRTMADCPDCAPWPTFITTTGTSDSHSPILFQRSTATGTA